MVVENMQQIIQTISNTLQSPVLAYKVAASRVCDAENHIEKAHIEKSYWWIVRDEASDSGGGHGC